MGKAFDLKNLLERLKAKGLTAAEQALKIVAGETLDWASESLMMSENIVLKFAGPIVAGLKPVVLKELDKLDGVAGN